VLARSLSPLLREIQGPIATAIVERLTNNDNTSHAAWKHPFYLGLNGYIPRSTDTVWVCGFEVSTEFVDLHMDPRTPPKQSSSRLYPARPGLPLRL
jgi:hypothetical protein